MYVSSKKELQSPSWPVIIHAREVGTVIAGGRAKLCRNLYAQYCGHSVS